MANQEEKQTLSQENVYPIAEQHLKQVSGAGIPSWFSCCFKPKVVETPKVGEIPVVHKSKPLMQVHGKHNRPPMNTQAAQTAMGNGTTVNVKIGTDAHKAVLEYK